MATVMIESGVYLLSVSEEVVCARRLADEPAVDLSDLLAPYVVTRRPGEPAVDLSARLAPYGDGP